MNSSCLCWLCCTAAAASASLLPFPALLSLRAQRPTDVAHMKHRCWCLLIQLHLCSMSLWLPHLLISSLGAAQRAALLQQPRGCGTPGCTVMPGDPGDGTQATRAWPGRAEQMSQGDAWGKQFSSYKIPKRPLMPNRTQEVHTQTHRHTHKQMWAGLQPFGPLLHTLTLNKHQNSLSSPLESLRAVAEPDPIFALVLLL